MAAKKKGAAGSKARAKDARQRAVKPHNAHTSPPFASLEDLVKKVAGEPRQVLLNGEMTSLSRGERTLRLLVDRALAGKARDVALVVRLMIKHPDLAKTTKTQWQVVIGGIDAFA